MIKNLRLLLFTALTLPWLLCPQASAHPTFSMIPDLPEPLMSSYLAGVAPSVKADLEARIAAERDTAVWISPSGLPGAAGTEADPMNLAEGSAFVSQTANRGRSILFHPGVYDARGFSNIINYGSHLNSASDFVIAAPDGPAVFNAGHTVPLSAMTDNGDGTWSFHFDGSLRDTPTSHSLMMVPVGGDGRSYFSRRNSPEEVAGGPRRYHFDVEAQTVRIRFEGAPTDVVISCSLRFASFHSAGATVGMYGLTLNHFRTGGPGLSNINFSAYEVHVNYAWDFQNRTDGWGIGSNTQATFENSSANFVQNDGFNSKGNNLHLRLVNCEAIGNNDDGYSPHYLGELWEVWGGLYKNNGKGNITPAGGHGFIIGATLDTTLGRMDGYSDSGSFRGLYIGTGENHPVVWIKDSIIRDVGPGSKAVYNQNAQSHVRLENTVIRDAAEGLFSRQGGKILAIDPIFINNDLDYNPDNANIVVIFTEGMDPIPVASLTASPTSGEPPLLVAFDASASFVAEGTIVRYDWDFGDGTSLDDGGAEVTHTYGDPDTYTATVTITTDSGATATASIVITLHETSDVETPLITQLPTASTLEPGQILAEVSLTGGLAVDSLGQPVDGIFSFVDPGLAPPLGTADYAAIFTPADTIAFTPVSLMITVTVLGSGPPPPPGGVAFMFNFGNVEYSGTNSPAHAEGVIPSHVTAWQTASGNATTQEVEIAGTTFSTTANFRRADGTDADSPVSLTQSSSTANRSGSGSGVFGTALTQSWRAYSRGGFPGRSVGAWFTGLEPGEYDVYAVVHNPVLIAAGRTTNVGIGVGSATSGSLAWNDPSLTGTSFAANPQTDTWQLGVNFARVRIEVTAENPIIYVIQGGPAAANNEFDYHTLTAVQIVRVASDPSDPFSDWVAENNITGGPADTTGGVANLMRYALGGDARTPSSELLPQVQSVLDPEGLVLSLTFERINDPQVSYAVWYSEDLDDWGSEPVWQDDGAHGGVPGPFEVTVPTSAERGFLRLEVSR
jgi:hypothetical protein